MAPQQVLNESSLVRFVSLVILRDDNERLLFDPHRFQCVLTFGETKQFSEAILCPEVFGFVCMDGCLDLVVQRTPHGLNKDNGTARPTSLNTSLSQ